MAQFGPRPEIIELDSDVPTENVDTQSVTPGHSVGSTPAAATPNPFDAFDSSSMRRSARRVNKRKSVADQEEETPKIAKKRLQKCIRPEKNMQHSPKKSSATRHALMSTGSAHEDVSYPVPDASQEWMTKLLADMEKRYHKRLYTGRGDQGLGVENQRKT